MSTLQTYHTLPQLNACERVNKELQTLFKHTHIYIQPLKCKIKNLIFLSSSNMCERFTDWLNKKKSRTMKLLSYFQFKNNV